MKKYFIPNEILNKKDISILLIIQISFVIFIWTISSNHLIPRPIDIAHSMYVLIFEDSFLRELLVSTFLCIKAIFYSTIISLIFAYLSVIPFFKYISEFIAKTRFLTTAGLTFLFAQILPDASSQKLVLLIFGITVFFVTSAISVISSIKKNELDYARTLKMNEWEVVKEVIIFGKAHEMFEIIRQNFAIAWMMLAMVESLCRSDGGIGVILSDQNKHFNFDSVYAIQIIILIVGILMDFILKKLKEWIFPYTTLINKRK